MTNANKVMTGATSPSIYHGFCAVLKRDTLAACRQPSDMLNPLVFSLMVVTMMPLSVSPESKSLALLAPGLLWLIALLASMLSLMHMREQNGI